jgi:hypothetical protein
MAVARTSGIYGAVPLPVVRPGVGIDVAEGAPLIVKGAAAVADGAGVITGIVGVAGAAKRLVGATLGSGTATPALTPRFPTSVESRGMPVRAVPPCVVGEVGVDEAAKLPEPEPHMPDMPEVSTMADVVGSADAPDIADAADVPGAAIGLEAAPVAGIAVPTDMPPPS